MTNRDKPEGGTQVTLDLRKLIEWAIWVTVSIFGLYMQTTGRNGGWLPVLLAAGGFQRIAESFQDFIKLVRELGGALRKVWRWGAPLRTLIGVAFLAVPSALFPVATRRTWLRECLEMLSLRKEQQMSYGYVFGSILKQLPGELLAAWADELQGPAAAFDLKKPLPLEREQSSYWHRHREEILWAAFWGLLFLIAWEIFHAWVLSTHHEMPWEHWFRVH
ncbi:hypothetical protein [Streptomyces sp. NPDC093984]|uniref:hypothetical protein n=1 Tax=Streptomyces sp. NPDC093984 TaxID=3366052 RepID=UPI0038181830